MFVLLSFLYSSVCILLWICFLFCVFLSFVFNCLISFLGPFVCLVLLLFFLFFGFVFVSGVCVCVCLCFCLFCFAFTICLEFCLSFCCWWWWSCLFDSVFTICLEFCLSVYFHLFSSPPTFSPPLLLWHVACKALVSGRGSGLRLRWERWVQDDGPPENSWVHGILIGQSSPGGLHLESKTWLHATVFSLQCWMPQAKQQAKQEYKPTHQQTGCLDLEKAQRHPKTHHLTWPCISEGQDPAPVTRTQTPVSPTRRPIQATGPTSSTGGRHQKQEELWPCSLQKGDLKNSTLDKVRRQRNMQQMKEQGKNPQDQINEEEIVNLPEKEFRVIIVKMLIISKH